MAIKRHGRTMYGANTPAIFPYNVCIHTCIHYIYTYMSVLSLSLSLLYQASSKKYMHLDMYISNSIIHACQLIYLFHIATTRILSIKILHYHAENIYEYVNSYSQGLSFGLMVFSGSTRPTQGGGGVQRDQDPPPLCGLQL